MVLGQLSPKKIAPRIIAHCIVAPWIIARELLPPREIAPPPPGQLQTQDKIFPENNCPSQANTPQRVL